MILDAAPASNGNVILMPEGKCRVLAADGPRRPVGTYYLDHHTTCPQGRDWSNNPRLFE